MKKDIIIITALLLVISVTIAGLLFYKSYTDNVEEVETEFSAKEMAVTALMDTLIVAQKPYADKLLIAIEDIPIESRLADLMAPLGPLDPIATDDGDDIQITTFTAMFGYYARSAGLSRDKTMFVVESPLTFALNDFDYKDYYKINSEKLDSLDRIVNSMDDIEIVGSWTSEMARVNNVFIDLEQGFSWILTPDDDGFYNYENIKYIEDDSKLMDEPYMQSIKSESFINAIRLVPDMYAIRVSTIYKCDGKTIYIMGSIGDNGFGFIKNANSAEEVNCGLLSNRFEIIKDEKLEDGWRFWIGR